MQTTIIGSGRATENDLVRETMEWMEIDDVMLMFEGDPDQLRIEGNTVYFIDLEDKKSGIRTVVYTDYSDIDAKIIEQMLAEFYAEDENGKDIFDQYYEEIESTRGNMNGLWNGIAYRGGSGYCYGLHQYKNVSGILW